MGVVLGSLRSSKSHFPMIYIIAINNSRKRRRPFLEYAMPPIWKKIASSPLENVLRFEKSRNVVNLSNHPYTVTFLEFETHDLATRARKNEP